MKWAALGGWALTAVGGFALFISWIRHGGMEQRATGRGRIRPWLVFAHLALAVAGLVVYGVYVAIDDQGLNWLAFLFLVAIATLGWWMFAVWLLRRRRERASATTGGGDAAIPAEQRFLSGWWRFTASSPSRPWSSYSSRLGPASRSRRASETLSRARTHDRCPDRPQRTAPDAQVHAPAEVSSRWGGHMR
jgi:hypothetical protein